MSRTSRLKNLDKDPHYGIFNAKVVKIEKHKVFLQDVLTYHNFSIDFFLKDELAKTKSGKDIWINQMGEVGYGDEYSLLRSFTHFPKSDEEKKYRLARIGDVHLMDFLRNYHYPNPFDTTIDITKGLRHYYTDYDSFKKLFVSDSEYDRTIGGLLYVNEDMEEKVFPHFIPSHKVSILKNCKGDFSQVKDYTIKNIFDNDFIPKGHYHWGSVKLLELQSTKVKKHNDSEI